jgi:hypothetical protein
VIQTFKEFLNEKYGSAGTYAAMTFTHTSELNIRKFLVQNDVPNPVPKDKLHVTLLYSRKPMVGYTPTGTLNEPMKVRVIGFDVWDTQDGKKALVARLDAPKLVIRHKVLMQKYDGTFDFDEYRPHFTMSYDVGPDFNKDALPNMTVPLYLESEYGEDLNTNWKEDDKTD